MFSLEFCINLRPSVSIVIPTYNRNKFKKLIEHNIKCQDYTNIKEVIICQDDNEEDLLLDIPYDIIYIRKKTKMNLGDKRNLLCSYCNSDIIANMDTDDLYLPTYISYSVESLVKSKKDVSGTANMRMYFLKEKKKCELINYSYSKCNEATLVYKKSYWEKNKFSSNLQEGIKFLEKNIHRIVDTDISKLMVCLCHETNTVDKQCWLKNEYKGDDFPCLVKLDDLINNKI